MAKPILVANWKNHPDSLRAAAVLLTGLGKRRELYKKLHLFLAPPSVYFESVVKRAGGFSHLASQDITLVTKGTHTGLITPEILKAFGVRLSIIGHSEVREMGETDKDVSEKVKNALKAGITPLLCVGEKAHDESGDHFEELRRQMKQSLDGVRRKEDASKLVIAYEPVWAIGSRAAGAVKPEDLAQTVIFIRKVLTDMYGRQAAGKIPVLYGGSVDHTNAFSLYAGTGIRGFLVGRASFDPKTCAEIAEALTS